MCTTVWVAIKDDGRDVCKQLEDKLFFTTECSPYNRYRCVSWDFESAEKIGNTKYMQDILSANTHNIGGKLAFNVCAFDWENEIDVASAALKQLYDAVHKYVKNEIYGFDIDETTYDIVYDKYKMVVELVYTGKVYDSDFHTAIKACSRYIQNIHSEIFFDDILSLEPNEFTLRYVNAILPHDIIYDNVWHSENDNEDWKTNFLKTWNKIPKDYSVVILDYCCWEAY